jgi:hypothetical protein
VDTVTAGPGESPYHVDATQGCVQSSIFKRGMRIVWRFSITNQNGVRVAEADVESVKVKLPTGQTLDGRMEAAGPPNLPEVWFWHATFDIPMDYPIGTVDYSIEVKTKDGKTGTFKQLPVPPAQLQVIG